MNPLPGAAESRMSRVMYFGLALMALAFLGSDTGQITAQSSELHPAWTASVLGGVLLSLLAMLIGSRWLPIVALRALGIALLVIVVVGLLTWVPAMTVDAMTPGPAGAWLWLIATLTPALGIIGLALRPAFAWMLLAASAVLMSLVMIVAGGGPVTPSTPFDDVVFRTGMETVVLGVVVVTLAAGRTRDRAAAATADQLARAAALEARNFQAARGVEFIHDNVFVSLIGAARFGTEDLSGVRDFARQTLDRLRGVEFTVRAESARELEASVRSRAGGLLDRVRVLGAASDRPLPPEVADAILEAVTEALRNVARHAGDAASAVVSMHVDEHSVRVEVRDDGRGFDPAGVRPEKLGLRVSIERRMRDVPGGSSLIESTRGAGTRVIVEWRAA